MRNPSTGIQALDDLVYGLRPGDNVVWKVDSVADYAAMVQPFWRATLRSGRKVVYFRYAQHERIVPSHAEVQQVDIDPAFGFEQFITQVHRVIADSEEDCHYVFDMFTDLVRDWFSERMVGNFFLLTCPYIRAIGAVGYFGVLRHYHAYYAVEPIDETAQVLVDLYHYGGQLYLHPLKVAQRQSPTMYLLHRWDRDALIPIKDSATTAAVTHSSPWPGLQSASYRMIGMWDRRFMRAEELLAAHRQGEASDESIAENFNKLASQLLSRDPRVIALLRRYLRLDDIVDVWKHVVGSGRIGGKSVGMLLARAVLRQADAKWNDLLEQHDSFYVASDVFYSFLVQNDCWWIRQKQKNPATLLDGIEEARARIFKGTFPSYLVNRFSDMLDYFGQSPIIVRSSSLLEDNFGNAFAGKYESVFCVNQGPSHKRLEDLLSAVRTIYASSMSEKALRYRAQRGLLDKDEQMALLVQRVSGSLHGRYFHPDVAGVGLSFNPYVWNREIDPEAGMLRLVFGLGTRAVDRSDDDYTRVVSLNAPQRRPETNFDEVRQYSQRKVDVLDVEANQLLSVQVAQVAPAGAGAAWDLVAQPVQAPGGDRHGWVLTFDGLCARTGFIDDMRQMLATLAQAYAYPLEVEFALNVKPDGSYRVNLLQCRPLQVKGGGTLTEPLPDVPEARLLLQAQGAVIGRSRRETVDRVIYVVPDVYGHLPIADRHSVARTIGQLAHLKPQPRTILLVGPGRWGTTTPSLGVPVTYADINSVSMLCEVVAMRDDLVPDVSLGTHFFNELVEMDVLYLALFPSAHGNRLNRALLDEAPNQLQSLLPSAVRWADCIRVLDAASFGEGQAIRIHANSLRQEVLVYLE